ncbi:MAG: vWA domain-containing protein [Polyangiales bacterium]
MFAMCGLLIGCGAKTGLYYDDGGGPDIRDAGMDTPDVPPDVPIPCFEVPREAGPVDIAFVLPVALRVADVFFLIDATASMEDEIDTIRERLRSDVVPGVRARIPEAQFGVALVGEFPVSGFGPPEVSPYDMRQQVTDELISVEAALERFPTWGNFDEPEAQVEGLFQVATGAGLLPWIEPSSGCPRGGRGGACFRRDALPVVLLITDAPMNNGPRGIRPQTDYDFVGANRGPHTFQEAVDAANDLGIFVIGLGARDALSASPMPHLRAMAQATGAIANGELLAIDIGGDGAGVGEGIVNAIARLAEGTLLDVDAVIEDVPGDEFDARTLVESIAPLEATPSSGVREITADSFLGVVPGTSVTFRVQVDAASVPLRAETLRIPARVLFRAFGRSRLDRREILLVVPGEDGGSCDTP